MYQTIIIMGYVGKDPEMRYTPSGQAVTSISVATNRSYTSSSGEQIKETTWFRVSAWGKQAEFLNEWFKKGKGILVEGRLVPDKNTGSPRIWNKADGTPAASFEITANVIRFTPNGGGENGNGASEDYSQKVVLDEPSEEDIPF